MVLPYSPVGTTGASPSTSSSSSILLLQLWQYLVILLFPEEKKKKKINKGRRILECLGWFVLGFILHYWILNLASVIQQMPSVKLLLGGGLNEYHVENTTQSTITTATTTTTTMATSSFPFDSPLKAVFFIGIEGTGHHLLQTVFQNSPTMDHLGHTIKLRGVSTFRERLHHHYTLNNDNNNNKNNNNISMGDGLWDAHCGGQNRNTKFLQRALRNSLRHWNEDVLEWNNNHYKNNTENNNNNKTNRNNHINTTTMTKTKTTFPVNTLTEKHGFGMVSYPNFVNDCRFLAYPNLDLWYDGVCEQAKVDCEHVYLYRDPTAILQSTTINRQFNPNVLSGIHLYIAMYHIIASQLLQESSLLETTKNNDAHDQRLSRTLGCYGFYEPNDTSSWWDGVRMIGGWGEPKTGGGSHKNDNNNAPLVLKNHNNVPFEDYDTFMTNMYKAPKPVNDSFIPAEYEMYMKPLKRIHDRVIQICKKNLAAREERKK